MRSCPALLITKKGALDSQPQVIKFTDGRWFSPGTLASSTTKTGRYDIAEILLKVALNTKKSITIHALFYTHDKMDVCFFFLVFSTNLQKKKNHYQSSVICSLNNPLQI